MHRHTTTELVVACLECLYIIVPVVVCKSKLLVAMVTNATLYVFASDVARTYIELLMYTKCLALANLFMYVTGCEKT